MFKRNVSQMLWYLISRSPVGIAVGAVVESLGSGASLEEVRHWGWVLSFIVSSHFPVYHLPLSSLLLLPYLPLPAMPPRHDGVFSLWNCKYETSLPSVSCLVLVFLLWQ